MSSIISFQAFLIINFTPTNTSQDITSLNTLSLKTIKILNWNCNGVKSQRSLLISFLARYNIDVACLTETHLSDGETLNISGYNIIRKDRSARVASGGTAIFIKKKYQFNTLSLDSIVDFEMIGLELKFTNQTYLRTICVYKQPNKRLNEQELQYIFDTTAPTILIGDLNSKCTYWGCRTNNPSGTKLNNICISHQAQVFAPEEFTYYPYRNDHLPDILDIAVAKNLNIPISQTVVHELNSDHLPVIISLDNVPITVHNVPKLINGIVNWKAFQRQLNSTLTNPVNIKTTLDIDITTDQITNAIVQSVIDSTKPYHRKKTTNRNIPPQYILHMINQKSRIRREWQRTRNLQLKTQLNNLTHKIKRELDKFRIESYKQTIASLEPNDPGLWRTMRIITKKPHTYPTIEHNNIKYNTDEEKATIFADHLEATFTPTLSDKTYKYLPNLYNYIDTHYPNSEDFYNPVTVEELKGHIEKIPRRKTPGHDLIPNIVLKFLTNKAIAYLASLFNTCLRLSYFPKKWKHGNILMFHKPGKSSKDVNNYRPITLLTTLSKLLEKVIDKRLKASMETFQIIPPSQFGFRKGHSTTHQLQRISEIIERGYEIKAYTAISFLDVAKAFDKVWTVGLRYKLLRTKIPRYIVAIIFSFLEDRSYTVCVHGTKSSSKSVNAGVPQGSILGPTLFLLYLHDMPHANSYSVATFADDTAIVTQHHDITETVNALQQTLDSLTSWFTKWAISINYSKTQNKMFTLRKIKSVPNIRIEGKEIPWLSKDESVKYLGVYLDTRLTWSYHINHKLNQGYARLAQLYSVINRKSNLKTECTLLLYKSLIRPLITYACPVWLNTSKTNMKKLQALQNKILRIAINAPWYMRNSQIQKELSMEPLETYIRKIATHFFSEIQFCDSAVHYDLGQRNIHTRIQRRLPQDLLQAIT